MSPARDDFSDTDSDGFNEDMEALNRACKKFTGENPTDYQLSIAGNAVTPTGSSEAESDEEGDEDLQLVRSIQERFAVVPVDMEDDPLMMKPLCTLPPDWSDDDDCEDDYATLRAIQRRFAAYNDGDNARDFSHRPVQVGCNIIDSEKETSNSFVEKTNAGEGFPNCVDTNRPIGKEAEACDDAGGTKTTSDFVECNGPGTDDMAGLSLKSSQFPKSALAFVDAIKQNRSFQKVIRRKMTQMEARMEELKKLTERVKTLKDFQIGCKIRTGRALSQKKDARVQLISLPKLKANTKLNDKKIHKGPPENAHVAYYKEAMTTFAVNVIRKKWSKVEKENLIKGVKQQFQEMLLQRSVDLLSDADGSYDPANVDSILTSIKDMDITPDKIRLFLPKVNWEQLAAMYVRDRSGSECQARFLNVEDPLISQNPWTAIEDKQILHIVQEKGLNNWIDIAASLGTNRTPFQCLARYQRSLNASILKREWTKEEDNQLRDAVETYGESNWQAVASVMEGRTGTQCSNRWLKTLHPARKRVGKWTEEEDKRLKVAATFFGPKTWRKIAKYVPGRTHVQCRERWVNCLDPSLNTAEWTEEEDSKLEMAIEEYGYCWSKVAACIPCRTDNQCLRRWKTLFPNEVHMLQEAKKIRKAALISNFVDRESERPALGPSDFRLPETHRITGSENVDHSCKNPRRSRRRKEAREPVDGDALSSEIFSEGDPRLSDGNEVEQSQGGSLPRKRRAKRSRLVSKNVDPSSSRSSPCRDATLPDDAEIRISDVNDGNNVKRKPWVRKKGSISSKSKLVDDSPTTTPGETCQEMIVIRPHKNTYRHSNPTEEFLLTPPTLDYPYEPQKRKKAAAKLLPRRRKNNDKTAEDTEKIDTENDHLPPFPDSMSLMEAFRGIKAMKKKMKSNSDAIHENGILDIPVFSGDDDPLLLAGDVENSIIMPLETEEDENLVPQSGGALGKRQRIDGDCFSSGGIVEIEEVAGSRNNRTVQFYSRLKKRKTEVTKMQ
ncbi:hypothetical protein CASFOL_015707 [Castilleja foliolosa]|uniref:Uncharacterized protein n=1 Tax=Castilleja foliolosa TaxID=1961234 RepID=A0ABD3DFX5_9LAMI